MRDRSVGTGFRIGLLCLGCRTVFVGVLFPWFVIGGLSKVSGLSMSLGPSVGAMPLSLAAYYAYVPSQISSTTAGLPDFSLLVQTYVGLMVLLELVLPALILLGFMTRKAAGLLVLHQIVFLVFSRPTSEFGTVFDASPFDMVPDQLLLWIMLLAPLALFGAGPVSVDYARTRWSAGVT